VVEKLSGAMRKGTPGAAPEATTPAEGD